MRRWSVLLVLVLLVGGVLYWRFSSRETVKESAEKPKVVKADPVIASGFGPQDLRVARPRSVEKRKADVEGEVEGVASVPTSSPDTTQSDAPREEFTDLIISRTNRPFEEFYRYRGGINVGVLGGDPGVLYAPQPRPLIDLDVSITAGASFSLRDVGVYASVSPVRVWGFRPAWFVGYDGVLTTGPGAHFDVLPRLSMGGYYDLKNEQPTITIGYRF